MTAKKDLKRRVRARQEKTGESYTAALAKVRKPTVPTLELEDVTALAAGLGIRCKVFAFPGIDAERALTKIRDALLATPGDPATERLRGALFENKAPHDPRTWKVEALHGVLDNTRHFFARARAGIGGVSGHLISVHVGETPVVGILWAMPGSRPPLFVLRSADEIDLGLGSVLHGSLSSVR
jgi:hypothetical protein